MSSTHGTVDRRILFTFPSCQQPPNAYQHLPWQPTKPCEVPGAQHRFLHEGAALGAVQDPAALLALGFPDPGARAVTWIPNMGGWDSEAETRAMDAEILGGIGASHTLLRELSSCWRLPQSPGHEMGGGWGVGGGGGG